MIQTMQMMGKNEDPRPGHAPATQKVDPVKDFLYSVRESRFNVCRCQRRLAQMEAQSQSVTTRMDASPGGGGGDPHRDSVLAALSDQRDLLRGMYAEAIRKESDVERFISGLSDSAHRVLLRLRYVDGLTWPQVQGEMEQSGIYYSERQIYRIHGDALQAARQLWTEQHPEGAEA